MNKLINLCKCGCGISLRKDNKTGYQKGHKPCPICGNLVKGSSIECCSKSCSAKLHWQNHPEMKETRVWNDERRATREKNKDVWVKNISKACQGRIPWNKNARGLQVAWNKDLSSEHQPFYGKKHSSDYYRKVKRTTLERYGVEYVGILANKASYSKKELSLHQYLSDYTRNSRIGNYRPDYLNEKTKHIIEFNGDFWHCNPLTYSPDFYHPILKMTAAEKWKLDEQRTRYLESLGYTVTVVWESDLKEFIRQLKTRDKTE